MINGKVKGGMKTLVEGRLVDFLVRKVDFYIESLNISLNL